MEAHWKQSLLVGIVIGVVLAGHKRYRDAEKWSMSIYSTSFVEISPFNNAYVVKPATVLI